MTDILGEEPEKYYTKKYSEKYNQSGGFRRIQKRITLDALRIINFSEGLILDLGCGTGFSTTEVKKQGHDVVGMDKSFEMISFAKQKSLKKLVVGGFTKLPFKKNVFTGIISISSIQWLKPEQYPDLIKELRRVLKPGGKIIIQYYPENKIEKKILKQEAEKKSFRTIIQKTGSGRKTKDFFVLF